MPRAKRPLAEADPNTLNASRKLAKTNASRKNEQLKTLPPRKGKPETRSNLRKQSSRRTNASSANDLKPASPTDAPERGSKSSHEEQSPETQRGEQIIYKTKDNSKLRLFLSERNLPNSGTREEMIALLENSSIDYEALPSGQLTDMLKRRDVKVPGQGTKEVKIQRLRLDDKLDRDRGNHEEGVLYGKFWGLQGILQGILAETDSANFDKADKAYVDGLRDRYEKAKSDLEARLGHPVEDEIQDEIEQERVLGAHDSRILQQAEKARPPKAICDYKWRDSHWADRTERQLREICMRREMPGSGPKAAMIKWLETGNIEYDVLYAFSLKSLCRDRGIKCKSGEKKAELVRLLKEADEREAR